MLIFYVRHGEPIYSPDSLTEHGKQQAQALVRRMAECKPDRIFASSSTRAIMTAQPTAEYLNKDIEILDWCHEDRAREDLTVEQANGGRLWCFNDSKVKHILNSEEVRKLDKKWYDHPAFTDTSFKKGMLRMQTELDNWMLSLGYQHDNDGNRYIAVRPNDDRIALFAHQGVGLLFLSCILDIPYPLVSTRLDMSFSNLTVIEFAGTDIVIPKTLQLSNDSHLFASGLSIDYQNRIHF